MLTSADSRHSYRRWIAAGFACALVLVLFLSLPPASRAQTESGSNAYGGTQFYARAIISDLRCQSLCPRGAASASRSGWVTVKEKGILRIRGRNFADVGQVVFLGGPGRGDNVAVKPLKITSRAVDVKVPVEAGSGPIALLDPAGRSSDSSDTRVRVLHSASSLSTQGFVWPLPVRGELTGWFGEPRGDHVHTGIDLSTPAGTPIRAVAEGRVILVGPQGAYGNFTCLRHAQLVSCYAHQDEIRVTYGQLVKQGQTIGTVGNTGRSSGSHLHFEVRQGPDAWSTPMDPLKFLPKRF
jgi:hypothetical protein